MDLLKRISEFVSKLLTKQPVVPPMAPVAPQAEPELPPRPLNEVVAEDLLSVIRDDIFKGLRETDGKNRSSRIDLMNIRAGVPLGSPYCAAGLWCAMDDVCTRMGLLNPMPRTGSSQAFRTQVPKEYLKVTGGKRGDFFVMQAKHDSARGHVGALTSDQEGLGFRTAEYNTNKAGSRDGDGAYYSKRSTLGDKSKRFRYFVDIAQWIVDSQSN